MVKIVQRSACREKWEGLLSRAEYLAASDRAILEAHLGRGMTVRQVAVLHRVSARAMRRRIHRLGEMLADPCFMLAAKYGNRLPMDLAKVASGYWREGRALRELAEMCGETLHGVRRKVATARSLLLLRMAEEQEVPSGLAREALDGRYAGR